MKIAMTRILSMSGLRAAWAAAAVWRSAVKTLPMDPKMVSPSSVSLGRAADAATGRLKHAHHDAYALSLLVDAIGRIDLRIRERSGKRRLPTPLRPSGRSPTRVLLGSSTGGAPSACRQLHFRPASPVRPAHRSCLGAYGPLVD